MPGSHLVRTGHKVYAVIFYSRFYYNVRVYRNVGTWEIEDISEFYIKPKPGASKIIKALCDLVKDKTNDEIRTYIKDKFPPLPD